MSLLREIRRYATRSGAPLEVIENLNEIEDEGEIYESIEDIWPDYPSKDDFFFNEEEYYWAAACSGGGRLRDTAFQQTGAQTVRR